MPTHDPDRQGSEFPDEISRHEDDAVSVEFSAGTERRTRRAVGVGGAALLICFLIVIVMRHFHGMAVAEAGEAAYLRPPPVEVVIARPVAGRQELVLPGETAAWFETILYARVNGYVAKWLVDIGDHVRKGQILAIIETPELDAEYEAARAQLKASEAQVEARKAEAEFSRTTNDRWRDSPPGVVSDQERDSKKADFRGAEARQAAAIAQVALDKARVDQYGALSQFKQVKAPFDGTITERRIDVGNLVTAGSTSATTPLYRLAQTDPLRVFVDVPQSASRELMSAGIPAEIQVDGAVGGSFSGATARAAGSLSAQARTMRVEVDMPNGTHALVPGMYVKVAFRLPPLGVVEVPAAALVYHTAGTEVARVDASGKVSFARVAIARDNGSVVELASGVQPGDRLVLNISSQISAGEQVEVRKPDAQAAAPAGPAAADQR